VPQPKQRLRQTLKREQLSISPEEAMKPWTGDLDGMIQSRMSR
jgi:hypothetical protein